MELKITVYDKDDKVIKECKAQTIDIKFGQVAALMELMDVENVNDSVELLRIVHKAWKQVIAILSKVFPDMNDDDWENVSMKELLPVVVTILKSSFSEMLTIPKSKNE
jgi:hypothetical protein